MPAIFGVIDLNKNKLDERLGYDIHKGYSDCLIDRYKVLAMNNVIMGLEQQIITKEDESDEWDTPIYDAKRQVVFVAEGTLDNRKDLLEVLECSDEVSDGWIMYLGYLKWNRKCVKYFRGVFSFAAYNIAENRALLYVDHFANNCLYYFVRENVLYFSTLLFPIIDASGKKFALNDRWLLECINVRGPALMHEPRECAYEGVFKVPAGHCIEITNKCSKEHRYWNPMSNVKNNSKITDKECKRLIRKYVSDSVKGCIRTQGEVAVSLSSGLDSTTVAAYAALALKEKNKKLYAFTSVPLKESNIKNTDYVMYDETDGVLELCKMYSNIEPEFLDCAGKNILTEAKNIVDYWELPCKTQQNGVWTGDVRKHAKDKQCKIMLTGATGNTTVSAGKAEEYVLDLVRHFKIIQAYNDLSYMLKKNNLSGKKPFVKYILNKYQTYLKGYFIRSKEDCYANTLTREDIGEKNNLTKLHYKRTLKYVPVNSIRDIHFRHYSLEACAQVGEIDTKNCLKYGTLERDPYRNVELIEFLSSLPLRCFVNREHDRRLIREFMEGMIPDSIRLNELIRGWQSGDNIYRISQSWNEKYNDIKNVIFSKESLKYLDKDKINNYLERIDDNNLDNYKMDVRMIVDAYTFGLFLEKINKYSKSTL